MAAVPPMGGRLPVRSGRLPVPGPAATHQPGQAGPGLASVPAVAAVRRRSWNRQWPLDPAIACALLAQELPGWTISYESALVLPGRPPQQYVYQATRPRIGGEESVECVYPDQLLWSIDRFCEVA